MSVIYSINLQRNLGLWSKGIRCESGTVPAAVNPECFGIMSLQYS